MVENTEQERTYQKRYSKLDHFELRAYHNRKSLMAYHALRDKILSILGGKCAKCGFDDKRALQIDHVNGRGVRARKGAASLWTLYLGILRKVENGSKEYQLLCANCNWIKRTEKRETTGRPRKEDTARDDSFQSFL